MATISEMTVEIGVNLSNFTNSIRNVGNQLRNLGSNINPIDIDVNSSEAIRNLREIGNRVQDLGDKAQEVGENLSKYLTVPLLGFGTAAGFVAAGFEEDGAKIQNSLGVTAEEAEKLTKTAKAIYKDGFGESMEDVRNALIQTKQNIHDLNDEDLQDITTKASLLADTFDSEVNVVTRAGNNLMQGFGLSAEEAFDLMAYGAQNGLNFSDELFDNLSEYAPLFGKMGFSADEYFQLLIKGSKAGVYNLDYINDAMKEFQIRLKDGSKSTADAMGEMSKETQNVWKSFLKGEKTVKDVHNTVIKELKSMENQTKANEIAAGLYGTKFEDLESDAVYALGNINGELEDVDGTMDAMVKTQEETFGQRFQSMLREAKSALLPLGEVLLDIAEEFLPVLSEAVQDLSNWFSDLSPIMKKTIVFLGAIGAVIGPVLTVLGPMITGVMKLGKFLKALTGPVGLAVTAIGLITGAVINSKKAQEEATEVNFEHAKSLIEQQDQLQTLTTRYEELRDKNKLSNEELLLFRDIQDNLKTGGTAEEVSKLSKQTEYLQEKSGLSNDELAEMLSLNDQLIEKVPETGRAFSDQGNSILENTDDIHAANEALRENLALELEIQQAKLDAKLDENIRNQIEATQELNEKIRELNNVKIEGAAKEHQLNELKKQQQKAYQEGQTAIADAMNNDIALLEHQINQQNDKVSAVASEVGEKQKALEKTGEEIAKTQELYNELINVQLAQVGINEKGAKGLSQLDQAIEKTQTRISELNQAEKAQGGLNAKQQEELDNLQNALGKYRETKGEIQNIQGEQATVNDKINQGKQEAGEMSNILSKSEVKDIKFTGNGYEDAKIISDEADKDVKKEIDVTDYGKANSIHDKAQKPATKSVTLKTIWSGITSGAKKLFGFASGTKNAPEGLAVVGEEGPELMYIPGGSKIIPNEDTEKILNSWNIPTMPTTSPSVASSIVTSTGTKPVQITNVITLDGYEIARNQAPYIDTMQSDKFVIDTYMKGGR